MENRLIQQIYSDGTNYYIPYQYQYQYQYQKDLFNKFKKQIFRNILNLNKYNPDNLEEEDDILFFYRDIKP